MRGIKSNRRIMNEVRYGETNGKVFCKIIDSCDLQVHAVDSMLLLGVCNARNLTVGTRANFREASIFICYSVEPMSRHRFNSYEKLKKIDS